ncbi:hypothetical protein ACFQ51_56580 [Streptomyces kaempferi]
MTDGLSADAVKAFGLIAAGLPVPAGSADSVAELTALGFVAVDPSGRPVALNPRDVAERRLREEIAAASELMDRARTIPVLMEQLGPQFERAQLRVAGAASTSTMPRW